MCAKVGGLSKINYKETRGIKVAGGSSVKAGTVLTRQGDKWKPGVNVAGRMHLTASCDGEIYFTKKSGSYKKAVTFVNVRSVEKVAKKKTAKKAVKE